MTPRHSFVGTLAATRWLASFRNRALVFGLAIVGCALLALFPQRFRAESTLTPTDPSSLGLSGTLGQLGALNSVFGNQAAIEVALRVGDSLDVRNRVIKEAELEKRLGKKPLQIHRWLHNRVDLRSLRGGIIKIDLEDRDPQLALDTVAAYSRALRDRLSEIARAQTAYKRDILKQLVNTTSEDLARAQEKYDAFRLTHQEAVPDAQTAVVAQRVDNLEAAYRAKLITLSVMRRMYTDDNFLVQQLSTEISALKSNLIQARGANSTDRLSVGNVVASTSILYKLQRELILQRSLYDSYVRFLQGTSVEDLTSTANVRILEPPHIDTERQYWLPAVGAGLFLLLLWGAIEFYRLRPPVGALGASSGQRETEEGRCVIQEEGHA